MLASAPAASSGGSELVKMKARRVAANEIDESRRTRDIAAHHAERLGERPLDDRQAVHQPVALGDAAAMCAVKADSMDLVEIGHCAVRSATSHNAAIGAMSPSIE